MMQVQQRVQWRAHNWAPYASERVHLPLTCQRDRGCKCSCRALYEAS